MKHFRLKDINVRRVDMVDKGANQEAHIVFAKADRSAGSTIEGKRPKPKTSLKPKESKVGKPVTDKPPTSGSRSSEVQNDLASKVRNFLTEQTNGGGAEPKPQSSNPIARERGSGSRIIRIAPTDFEVVSMDGNMMEWAVPPDKLPEGVEEATVIMVQSGETVAFQWMIDPLAGPPIEGSASTAAEAFVAMRGALTTQGAMDPMAMLGGFPNQKPGQQPVAKRTPGIARALRALAAAKKKNKARMARGEKPIVEGKEVSPGSLSKSQSFEKITPAIYREQERRRRERESSNKDDKKKKKVSPGSVSKSSPTQTVDEVLDILTKGLIQVDIFKESTTGHDLRDILPSNLLEELQQVSANQSAE